MKRINYSNRISMVMAIIIILVLIVKPNEVGAELDHQQEWQKLNQFAEEALFLVQRAEYDASRKRLNDLSAHFLTLELTQHLERIDQAKILIEAIIQARNELNRASIAPEEAERQVLRLRLALDAVSHKKQPLWLNYYSVIDSDLKESIVLLEEGQRDQFYQSINQLLYDYEFIRPAIFVSHSNSLVQQLDSQIQFFSKESNQLWENKEQTAAVLEQFDSQLKQAFFKETDKTSIQSLLYLLLGIGGMICSALCYVAYRKYKGEKEAKTVHWRSFSEDR